MRAITSQAVLPKRAVFGRLPDGREATLYTLVNRSGMRADVTDFGAALVSLFVPDRNGMPADTVLGYDTLEGYVRDRSYLGVTVGRCANRIARGCFRLEGNDYQVTRNEGRNHLHGGAIGFQKVLWTSRPVEADGGQSVELMYESVDGEEGYPGNVTMQVVYTLSDSNEIIIGYTGTTDRPTVLNPSHHSYFNLTGSPTTTVLDHHLRIDADAFTPVDRDLIPTGEIRTVEGTPMDFRTLRRIGVSVLDSYEQLLLGNGFDHNWVLRGRAGEVREVAELYDPASGRCLTLSTDQPGLQFYSGNALDGTTRGKYGVAYRCRTGLCLEAQQFPDAVNKPHFPPATVGRDGKYRQTTIYRFSVR